MDNAAIIVSVNKIEKHPNADKLQIVRLFGTQVIVGLDTEEGDTLVYVDSNMRMSKEFLYENNLYRQPELNKDNQKTGFFENNGRVKCIKLRGELSDGFLFPLNYLEFTNGLLDFLDTGFQFNMMGGIPICKKYVLNGQKGSGSGNNQKSTKKLEVPMFKEHFSTGQFMREQKQIPAGTMCYIEEKIHGTSHRTGRMSMDIWDKQTWWYKLFYKLANGFNKIPHVGEWIYINGTRRVIHTPDKIYKYHHDNTMREEVLEKVRGLLLKGEEIYLELFGHEKTGKEVQKGFPYNTGDGDSAPYRTLLYRVTMNNEDGQTVDYNREAVYSKAEELGFEKPHLFEKVYYDGSEQSMIDLENKVMAYAQGMSALGIQPNEVSDTLKEGVVIWFINSGGHWKALKYKSDAFRLKESGNRDKGIIDQEDIN